MFSDNRRGFTLVELLVVIAIIGILMGLLLPAVQTVREAARRAHCSNNVYQLARGCLQHESKHQFLPTGGWAWGWAGEPDRGYTKKQPGGWHYNVLPYIEQEPLHDMGKGGSNRSQGRLRAQTPVALFVCPTRRKVTTYPYTHGSPYCNIDNPNPIIGRSDYAANAGDGNTDTTWYGPGSLAEGDAITDDAWGDKPGGWKNATGVIYRHSECSMAHIKDGATYTYLLGERYLNPDKYFTGDECDNDQGWDLPYDYDVNRWTVAPPAQDRAGYGGCMTIFGSAHSAGFHMAFCDGAVRRLNFNIDPTIHRQLGNRKDGEPTSLAELYK